MSAACPTYCTTCVDELTCTQCDPTYLLVANASSCVTSCPPTQYQFDATSCQCTFDDTTGHVQSAISLMLIIRVDVCVITYSMFGQL
jgi:hypothetical protein